MGTRLYANTTNATVITKLAGVPEMAAASLDNLEARYAGDRDAFYDVLFSDEAYALNALHAFKLNGWGKLREDAYLVLDIYGQDGVSGGVTDPRQVASLLQAQGVELPDGVDIADLEGVYWC